jgi:hypothetical protein
MLKAQEQRERRQAWMRELQTARTSAMAEPSAVTRFDTPVPGIDPNRVYALAEAGVLLGCSIEKARRMLRHQPGVRQYFKPGGKRPMIRIPGYVIERVIRASLVRG